MNTNHIRGEFLAAFRSLGHEVVPSDSLVPSGDPTLLFTSAGMVRFKKHFLGQTRLENRRAASAQKCLRTSDIDRVGLTARHLTFFEMLGNFSFGDYFKAEAVRWAWDFLTKNLGLDEKRLSVSVFREDDEAFALWKKIVPESRIVRLGEDSNFWSMGETGPCGPCSEILYDSGAASPGHDCPGPGCDCDRHLEVWNLVFTQFDKRPDGSLAPLAQKNIDTGMGLERLSMAANGKASVFDIDLFENLSKEIRSLAGRDAPPRTARVVSDHIRAGTFLVSDGILPSNEGRGYILRRLIRRALREGWTRGARDPFLHKLVAVVARDMGGAYPELREREKNIESIILTEERNAIESIAGGTEALAGEIKKLLGRSPDDGPLGPVRIPGGRVYMIYETYGLDKEIQKETVRDWGGELLFSEQDYESARDGAVRIARKGWKGSGEKDSGLYADILKETGPTAFKGYETLETETEVLAVLKKGGDGHVRSGSLAAPEEGEVILKETPFYAESGGQAGDRGTLRSGGVEAEVLDTRRPHEGLTAHRVAVRKGTLAPGAKVLAAVDGALRSHTMRHHTATHLLHAALRRELGSQVTQAGSLVSPDKLRFDFTFPRALTGEELSRVETGVNRAVLSNRPRDRREVPLDEARKIGALAFFGDKYGAKVFVVGYGELSTEVCGGTHCLSTGEIGFFKILSESSAASGVRRIEAVAGEKALAAARAMESSARKVAEKLRCSPEECPEKLERLLQKQGELEREVRDLKKKGALPSPASLGKEARVFKGAGAAGPLKILAKEVGAMDPDTLREAADAARESLGSGIVLLASADGGKNDLVVTVTPDLPPRGYRAGNIAKAFSDKVGGNGGGRDLFAQGGGRAAGIRKILETFPDEIAKLTPP